MSGNWFSTIVEANDQTTVLLDVPLFISGESEDGRAFREETFTLTVSAHGALVILATRVVLGQRVVLMNPKNWDEVKT